MRAVYTELSNFGQKEKLTNWSRGLLCKKNQLHTYFCDKITVSPLVVLSHQDTEISYK